MLRGTITRHVPRGAKATLVTQWPKTCSGVVLPRIPEKKRVSVKLNLGLRTLTSSASDVLGAVGNNVCGCPSCIAADKGISMPRRRFKSIFFAIELKNRWK